MSETVRLDIDPDLLRARMPPRELYRDPAWWKALVAGPLRRGWHCLGSADGLEAAGAARPFTLLPGSLDEPVVLLRGADGVLRMLSNACTHRGHLVVEQAGTGKALRCGYHGRGYTLDGRCTGAPGFEGVASFPGEDEALTRFELVEWRGLLFGSLAPEAPWKDVIAPVEARAGSCMPAKWRRDATLDRAFEFDAHFALYVENYLEGLHIPFLHPALNARLDWKNYGYANFDHATLQVGIAADGEPALALPAGHPDAARGRVAALYFWLFPTTMLNLYPWGLSLNVVEPLGPSRTRVRFHSFVERPELHDRGAGSGLVQVELEDERAALQVMKGLAARTYRGGRYAPAAEAGVHAFHRMLVRTL
ncbi:MAG: aromatic ring-hydroxylating dioxygenase subunit alpha [Planctomycetes bacterium]|nr:aromatic ring-hydroxylating dioxygenase subunit alpha [Planctomycetota bacterium]